MIICSHNCIHAVKEICQRGDVVIGLSGCANMVKAYDDVYYDVIEHFGRVEQLKKTCEELGELKEAVIYPYNPKNILEEVADVLNMIEQLKLMFALENREISKIMADKMKRTIDRMDKSEQGHEQGQEQKQEQK